MTKRRRRSNPHTPPKTLRAEDARTAREGSERERQNRGARAHVRTAGDAEVLGAVGKRAQASGWPLVSLAMDAAIDEAEALTALLSDPYRYFDFIQPELIAGDGAWDEVWAHRLCELFYGLAPVFRHTERAAATTTLPGGNQSNTVRGFTHDGRLVCMDHGREMPFNGFERAPRGDLRPGQGAHGHPDSEQYQRELAQRANQFRVRALHQHGPGPAQRVGLKTAP